MLKTFAVDLRDIAGKGSTPAVVARLKFCNVKRGSGGEGCPATKLHEGLGWDGLPMVGSWVKPGDALYCVVDELTGKITVGKVCATWRRKIRRVQSRCFDLPDGCQGVVGAFTFGRKRLEGPLRVH